MDTALLNRVEGAGPSPADTAVGGPSPAAASAPTAPASGPVEQLEIGSSILGKYTVQGVLGYGGFAVVYAAEHLGLRRPVAIKVLHVRSDTPLALIERFRREARISALVRHGNVLEAYDTGTLEDGSPYLVMERINGQNLSHFLGRGPLPIATAVEIGRQLLQGLEAIAEEGIVHRDIKPENVMLHDAGDGAIVVKLVDFGIAKRVSVTPEPRLTYHGALVGTPQYMAPEQIRGEEVDVRSDLYATGAILYEALSGHPPHETSNFSELVVAVLGGRIEPLRRLRPDCPFELDRAILRALARSPARRYDSAAEFLAALDQLSHKLALPSGAEAFRARGEADVTVLGPARNSATFVRWLRQAQGPRSRALQLTFMALLLGAPGAMLQVRGGSGGASARLGAQVGPPPSRVAVGDPVVTSLPSARASSNAAPAQASALIERAASLGEPIAAALRNEPGVAPSEPRLPSERSTAHPEAARESTSSQAEPAGRAQVSAGEGVRASERAQTGPEAAHTGARAQTRPETVRTGGSAPAGPEALRARDGAEGSGDAERAPAPGNGGPSHAEPSDRDQLLGEPGPASATAGAGEPWIAGDDAIRRRAWEGAMREGLAALVRGQLGAARERYLEAVRIDAREPAGFRGLGLVAARLGDRQQANTALVRYLALAPHASDAAAIRERIAGLSSVGDVAHSAAP